ncbi:50S ribosomal protein L11 methyltransferase [Fortiea contorta]|uniref:50S ribosomal protein L11 methyltransferase n=1 Tax=Fortiea contorta TaxID=1892405 RepID=UPI000347E1C0|nr:50S ribosomal protein L11 methyltransferase [Fortiea contorta]
MSLIELSLDTTHEAVDWVCTLLAETVDIADVEIAAYSHQNSLATSPWAFTIHIYLPDDNYSRVRVEKIVNLLSPLHRTGLATTIESNLVEKPINTNIISPVVNRIGERFVVLAPHAPYPSPAADEIIIRLAKTLAFGSGLHPATILSLQLLEKYILPQMNVLDLGSGSGILSVAIAKLGAQVLALDNDHVAVQATQNTVRLNSVEPQVTVVEGSLGCGSEMGHWMGKETSADAIKIEDTPSFHLIVANILARIHVALADDFRRSLRHTNTQPGLLITAGFTIDQEEIVNAALTTAGFEVIDCARFHEWVALVYQLY